LPERVGFLTIGAMSVDALELAQQLVSIDSVSRHSNAAASDLLHGVLEDAGFEVERVEYDDPDGERKVNLVGRRGNGSGGFGLFSHSDTVPGDSWTADPFTPRREGDRLIGLGSCDMKGPLAATIEAAAAPALDTLVRPVYVVVTADEEVSGRGALQVAARSRLYRAGPARGVVAEPTRLTPVYAHKGGAKAVVTAHGRAAHSSTGKGVNATFLIAPFLAEMARLAEEIQRDESFLNHEFVPPHNCVNVTIDDGRTRPNVTAAKTVCTLAFRPMPDDRSDDLLAIIRERAERHGLHFKGVRGQAFRVAPECRVVQLALQATGVEQAVTVGFGTDAFAFMNDLELVVLGPGNIAQAHTEGEWIAVPELRRAVAVYRSMIDAACGPAADAAPA
jgi:acetylornithine deacetylase